MARYVKTHAYPDHSVAFVMMPKNGWSSLTHALPGKAVIHKGTGPMRDLVEHGFMVAAIIRDPLDRLLSAWRFFDKTTQGPSRFEGIRVSDGVTFEDFCEQVLTHPLHRLDKHFQPQSLLLSDDQGLVPNRLLRFERLSEEWDDLREDTTLPLPPLPHRNQTDKSLRPVTDQVLELVHEKLADDYRVLGYTLPEFDKPS